RARILPDEHREKVFATKMPQSIPTILVDGHVAGTWRYLEGRVVPTPFTPLSRAAGRAVDEEAERLTALQRAGCATSQTRPPPHRRHGACEVSDGSAKRRSGAQRSAPGRAELVAAGWG